MPKLLNIHFFCDVSFSFIFSISILADQGPSSLTLKHSVVHSAFSLSTVKITVQSPTPSPDFLTGLAFQLASLSLPVPSVSLRASPSRVITFIEPLHC